MKNQKASVVLYSKPGCHLCEVMKARMNEADCVEHYDLQEVNIETDDALFAQYRYDIPVLTINGVEAFRHRLSVQDFRNAILRELRESKS